MFQLSEKHQFHYIIAFFFFFFQMCRPALYVWVVELLHVEHTNIYVNDVVLSDIKFTSAAIDDNFRLNPTHYNVVTLIAIDTVYIYYTLGLRN